MLDAELNKTYWRRIVERHSQWDKNSKIFLAIISSGTVAAWVAEMQGASSLFNLAIVWKALSGISAIFAVSLPILDWQRMINDAAALFSGWNSRHSSYQLVYSRIGTLSDEEIYQEYEEAKKDERILDNAVGTFHR